MCILPLPALARLVDVILAARLHDWMNARWPITDGYFIGCLKGTQCADIAASVHIAIEKMLDCKSRGAISQADIRRFYDAAAAAAAAAAARVAPKMCRTTTFQRVASSELVIASKWGGEYLMFIHCTTRKHVHKS